LGKAKKLPELHVHYEAAVGAALEPRTALARTSTAGRSGISELYRSQKERLTTTLFCLATLGSHLKRCSYINAKVRIALRATLQRGFEVNLAGRELFRHDPARVAA